MKSEVSPHGCWRRWRRLAPLGGAPVPAEDRGQSRKRGAQVAGRKKRVSVFYPRPISSKRLRPGFPVSLKEGSQKEPKRMQKSKRHGSGFPFCFPSNQGEQVPYQKEHTNRITNTNPTQTQKHPPHTTNTHTPTLEYYTPALTPAGRRACPQAAHAPARLPARPPTTPHPHAHAYAHDHTNTRTQAHLAELLLYELCMLNCSPRQCGVKQPKLSHLDVIIASNFRPVWTTCFLSK